MIKEKNGLVLLAVYIALLVLTVVLVLTLGAPKSAKVQRVGFVATGSVTEPGLDRDNYEGLRAACGQLGLELLVRDNVAEYTGDCPRAVQELVEGGAEMIVLSAQGYSQEMAALFVDYSDVAFYGLYSNLGIENLTGYSSRMYQARYLSGIVAGLQTKTGKIGFVATTKTSEVCRGVNAFALGVQRVAPEAEVVLTLTGSNGDQVLDTLAAQRLIREAGVDVITHHQNQYAVMDAAAAEGVSAIGYNEVEEPTDNVLVSISCDWEVLYTDLLREYLRGRSSPMLNDWLGLESGAIGLTDYSSKVSQATIDEVERARGEILAGIDVFTNEIYDNEGVLRCGAGEAITDEMLSQGIDWLAEGVRVYE